MADLMAAYRHTTRNRAEIEASRQCGCCQCQQVFPADEVVAWSGLDFSQLDNPDTAEGDTAVCPRCGGEAVLGDSAGFALTPQFLDQMNDAWFQRTIVHRPGPRTPPG